jgi:hypothetical protein
MKKYLFYYLQAYICCNPITRDFGCNALLQDNLNGTARRLYERRFGALGGDFSSIGLNPAGSAVLNNQFGITITNSNIENNSIILAQPQLRKTNFDLNQAGGVFVFNNQNSNS